MGMPRRPASRTPVTDQSRSSQVAALSPVQWAAHPLDPTKVLLVRTKGRRLPAQLAQLRCAHIDACITTCWYRPVICIPAAFSTQELGPHREGAHCMQSTIRLCLPSVTQPRIGSHPYRLHSGHGVLLRPD